MKRWTLDEIREALSALARGSGAEELVLHVASDGDAMVEVIGGGGYGRARRRPGASEWSLQKGDQDPIDRVLGRGEYQP